MIVLMIVGMIVVIIVSMIFVMIVTMIMLMIVAMIVHHLGPLTLRKQQWPTYSVAEFI